MCPYGGRLSPQPQFSSGPHADERLAQREERPPRARREASTPAPTKMATSAAMPMTHQRAVEPSSSVASIDDALTTATVTGPATVVGAALVAAALVAAALVGAAFVGAGFVGAAALSLRTG